MCATREIGSITDVPETSSMFEMCRPSSPRRRRINNTENGEYSHVNGNYTPFEQREKRRQAEGNTAHSKAGQSDSGRLQVRSKCL